MAAKKKSKQGKTTQVKDPDLYQNSNNYFTDVDVLLYYNELHFIPVEQKDKVWAARVLMFNKYHSRPFMDPNKAMLIRKDLAGELDEAYHKKRIDPEFGKAEFFSADFKANPIDRHIDEIIENTIKQIAVNLSVKAVDEYSISNKEANNRKIMGRSLLRNIINQINTALKFPLLKNSDDPFKYISNMQAQVSGQGAAPVAPATAAGKNKFGSVRKSGLPNDVAQTILNQITSSDLLGVYNEYLHKEGVEIACELGMDYYLNVKNKFQFNHAQPIISNILAFNKCCMRLYTSETTGTPVLDRYEPDEIMISEYSKRDISDHYHWHREWNITYSEFIRQFGGELEKQHLIDIFQLNNRNNGTAVTGTNSINAINNAMINVGYMEFQSQDMEVYADYKSNGNDRYKKMPSDFMPGYRKDANGNQVKDDKVTDSKRDESHYNVWYKCYYIPYYLSKNDLGTFDFVKQARFIFKFGKLQDQERWGDEERFARSSLVGFYSNKMPFQEIKKTYMTEINHLWQLIQNDISNIHPHGLNWAYDVIVNMVSTVDAANANNKNGVEEWAAKVKQTGTAITKVLRNAAGDPIANFQPFTEIKTGHLEAAMAKMEAIAGFYDQMLKALGQNDISEGAAPKPRTNLGSIQLSLGASGKSTYFIEEAFTDIITCLGNKLLVYFKDIVEDGPSDRLQELEDLVGQANYAALMEIKSIPMRNLGLYVENTMTADQKTMVMELASSMASAGTLDVQTALFLTMIDNLKQAYAILVFAKDKMDKQLAAKEQQQQQNQMALINAQTQSDMAKIKLQGQIKEDLQKMLGTIEQQLEMMVINLKGHWQMASKEQIKNNRIEQDITGSQIDKLNGNGEDAIPGRRDMPVAS